MIYDNYALYHDPCPYCSTTDRVIYHTGRCPVMYPDDNMTYNVTWGEPILQKDKNVKIDYAVGEGQTPSPEVLKHLTKTPAELIDALITVDIKCYMFQDKQVEAETYDEKGQWGERVMELNRKRNNLMRALDYLLGYGENTVTPKSYMDDKSNDLEREF